MLPPGNDSTSLVFEQSKALAELTNADIKNSLASEESFDALYFVSEDLECIIIIAIICEYV